jgi:hypothetical protein
MRGNMQEFLLYGIPKQELEKVMQRTFEDADLDKSGQLSQNVSFLLKAVLLQSLTNVERASGHRAVSCWQRTAAGVQALLAKS